MKKYLPTLFVALAGICKAAADTLAHHYSSSIWAKKDYKFWDPNRSWEYAKRVFAYPIDAWHISNSLMIAFFLFAVITYQRLRPFIPILTLLQPKQFWILRILDYIILSIIFVIFFNTFYNHIWVRP